MAKVLEEKTTPAFDLDGYVFDDRLEVLAFLEEHPSLVPLLAEAIGPVRRVFGEDTLISAFLVEDHDGDDDVALLARIQTTRTIPEARKLRSQFYCDWWNANSHRAGDRLVFDMDFVAGD